MTREQSFVGLAEGIGGCPCAPGATGNVCTEEIVHALQLMGYDTGVDLAALVTVARRLPALIGRDFPSQIAKAGTRLDRQAACAGGDRQSAPVFVAECSDDG